MHTEFEEIVAEQQTEEQVKKVVGNFTAKQYARVNKSDAAVKSWQMAVFLLTALLGFSIWAQWNSSKQRGPTLYVVGLNGARAEYLGLLKASDPTQDRALWTNVVLENLSRFIETWRTITTDQSAAVLNKENAYRSIYAGSQANTVMDEWWSEKDQDGRLVNNPFGDGQRGVTQTVEVTGYEVSPDSNTVRIWWKETRKDPNMTSASVKRWLARITYIVKLPSAENQPDESVSKVNPFGIFVQELVVSPDIRQ